MCTTSTNAPELSSFLSFPVFLSFVSVLSVFLPRYTAQMARYYGASYTATEVVARKIGDNDYLLVCLRHTEEAKNTLCQLAFQCQRQFVGIRCGSTKQLEERDGERERERERREREREREKRGVAEYHYSSNIGRMITGRCTPRCGSTVPPPPPSPPSPL